MHVEDLHFPQVVSGCDVGSYNIVVTSIAAGGVDGRNFLKQKLTTSQIGDVDRQVAE